MKYFTLAAAILSFSLPLLAQAEEPKAPAAEEEPAVVEAAAPEEPAVTEAEAPADQVSATEATEAGDEAQ